MKRPFVICLSAMSGGGKTTLTNCLKEHLPRALSLHFDDYKYPREPEDVGAWARSGCPPEAWDLTPLEEDIKKALSCGQHDYVLLDCFFGRNPEYPIARYIDLAIWIDSPADIALARRILRDFQQASAQDILSELERYLSFSRPCFIQRTDDRKNYDLTVDGSLSPEEIARLLIPQILARAKE